MTLPRIFTFLPHFIQNAILKFNLNYQYFNQTNWKIPTKNAEPASGSLTSNPEFVELVQNDTIGIIHGTIDSVLSSSNSVSVEINQILYEFDHVIFCTGYNMRMNFLDEDARAAIFCDDNHVNLYLNMYPLRYKNLSFVGLFNTRFTSPFQVIELQAYYNAQIILGEKQLPDDDAMGREISRHNNYLQKHCQVYRGSLFVESNYRTKLLSLMGTKPGLTKMLCHPRLLIQYYLGPLVWSNNFLDNNKYEMDARIHLDDICRNMWGNHWYLKISCAFLLCLALLILIVAILVGLFCGFT